jgi:hypothetical protein
VWTVWEPNVSRLFGAQVRKVPKLRHPSRLNKARSGKAQKLVQVGNLASRGEKARLLVAKALEAKSDGEGLRLRGPEPALETS